MTFRLEIKKLGSPPNIWKWELYLHGQARHIAQSKEGFPTRPEAFAAGLAALRRREPRSERGPQS